MTMDFSHHRSKIFTAAAALILCVLLIFVCFSARAFGAVDYQLQINSGDKTFNYSISTAIGVDNDGLPLVPLSWLRNATGVDIGYYNTGYGGVLVWARTEAPVVMLVDYSRIYTLQNGGYTPQAWVGTATTKSGTSYIPLKLTPYLGFTKTVDTAKRTIVLTMAPNCTTGTADTVYNDAQTAVMSYLNPPVVWLGSATTYYKTSMVDRSTNVALATAALNNVVIKAGQEFSFNKVVGQRTAAKGYKKAIIFSGGGQVMGLGGGVCQVSTTLYQATKKCGLSIVERHIHSQNVSYTTLGNDATVSYGSKDFRFNNNTGGNIYIKASASGGVLTISFYKGTLPSDTAKYLQ